MASMLRRFSKFNQGRTFFNRKDELAALNGRLVAAVGDSGDVVSGGNLVVKQGEGEYPGVSSIADMRNTGSVTLRGVARMFKSSFLPSVKATLSTKLESCGVLQEVQGQLELQMDEADDMDSVLAAIRSYGVSWNSLVLKGGDYAKAYPTSFWMRRTGCTLGPQIQGPRNISTSCLPSL
ncbi:uncharacterized protein LOC9658881 isoform X2 [Selaginella moellendorffii]|uniref:uncharacterized protein LOC9658881 isoform X2 n=1 Tax=Selaginella moellendorffii TaxID=88036 RepID=UPI000D1CE572|nr:uncharacterized protein LOC9658881 isoform X2 [Selaginella moellendorffii]|eukprot:XP_024529610.1 uncharacterized protein LOC9658881 isoform X2 [Selaginella moellendorffii]